MNAITRTLYVFVSILLMAAGAWGDTTQPDGLMCDLLAHPDKVPIVDPHPRFSWVVNDAELNEMQTSYEIVVRDVVADPTGQAAKPFWDSAQVNSDQSAGVVYNGPSLQPSHDYTWKVRVWNKDKVPGAWSAEQAWHTGILRQPGQKGDAQITAERYPIELTDQAPVEVKSLGPNSYFIDFGKEAFGQLKFMKMEQEGMEIRMGEALQKTGEIDHNPPGSLRYFEAKVDVSAKTDDYILPLTNPNDLRQMPPEVGAVMPFRYVELDNAPETFGAEHIRQIMAHYPFDDAATVFMCSDSALNDIWEYCKYSIKATSYAGVYLDGDRSRTPREAEAGINQLGHYCVDREFSLARYSSEYLILHPTSNTEWILQSVMIAWNDYLYTGDITSLAAFYPDLQAKTLCALEQSSGLISTKPTVPAAVLAAIHCPQTLVDMVDYPENERDNYDFKPVNTVVNAFHFRAVVLMAKIADALGKAEDAKHYRLLASQIQKAFNAQLVNPNTGFFVDGVGSTHSSLHANAFSVALGVVPQEKLAKMAQYLQNQSLDCSVYGAQYFLESLYATEQGEMAHQLMLASRKKGWSQMIDSGATITTEDWSFDDYPKMDWTHAWGAAPANLIPRKLMGIEPIEPAFRKMRIWPQPGNLDWARIDLATVAGTVHVDYKKEGGKYILNIKTPANTLAEVYLPIPKDNNLFVDVDGALLEGHRHGGYTVVEGVGSGTHVLMVSTP